MKIMRGVVLTNQVNLKGSHYTTQTVVDCFLSGSTYIMHQSHDITKPAGWGTNIGLYFEKSFLGLIAECAIPENESEIRDLKKDSKEYIDRLFFKIDDTDRKAIDKEIGIKLSSDAKYIGGGAAGFIGVYDKNIVLKRFPFIKDVVHHNKHKLFPLSRLKPVGQGIYRFDNLVIFASKYFRRSFSRFNNLNSEFLQELEQLPESCDVKIALDFDIIGLYDSCKKHQEFDYWWGPKFDSSFENINYGVARHGATEKQKLLSRLKYTDFYWHEQDEKHCFECEEVLDENLMETMELYGMRYVHSLIDKVSNTPCHLDGAIRFYDLSEYLIRSESEANIKGSVKASNYQKLWRADGRIETEQWKRLICHYFRDNSLPGEYFDGIDELLPHTDKQSSSDENLKDDGDKLRLMIYKKDCNADLTEEYIEICSDKGIKDINENMDFIEIEAINILKRLSKTGVNINVTGKDIQYVSYTDPILNLPLIKIKSANSMDLANRALEIVKDSLSEISSIKYLVSLKLSVFNENIWYTYQYLGPIHLLLDLIKDVPFWYSEDEEEFKALLVEIHEWIKMKCPRKMKSWDLSSYQRKSTFYFPVEQNTHHIEVDGSIASVYDIKNCVSCGINYMDCNCIDEHLPDSLQKMAEHQYDCYMNTGTSSQDVD